MNYYSLSQNGRHNFSTVYYVCCFIIRKSWSVLSLYDYNNYLVVHKTKSIMSRKKHYSFFRRRVSFVNMLLYGVHIGTGNFTLTESSVKSIPVIQSYWEGQVGKQFDKQMLIIFGETTVAVCT